MNMSGWFFVYTSFDNMENRLGNAVHNEQVKLRANDEAGAVAEAKEIWDRRKEHEIRGWDRETYPKNPRVIYISGGTATW